MTGFWIVFIAVLIFWGFITAIALGMLIFWGAIRAVTWWIRGLRNEMFLRKHPGMRELEEEF